MNWRRYINSKLNNGYRNLRISIDGIEVELVDMDTTPTVAYVTGYTPSDVIFLSVYYGDTASYMTWRSDGYIFDGRKTIEVDSMSNACLNLFCNQIINHNIDMIEMIVDVFHVIRDRDEDLLDTY